MWLEATHGSPEESPLPSSNPCTGAEITAILIEKGWLSAGHKQSVSVWAAQAAALLGPQAASRSALEDLLGLIFQYDAAAILHSSAAYDVLSRVHAREVLREAANLILEGPEVDSDRFKEIIARMKERQEGRGRILFHPIRLALAGRAGEGDLDRVILLLDSAARLPTAVSVKGTRQRILEFCSNLD
jgi:hypothetical protein